MFKSLFVKEGALGLLARCTLGPGAVACEAACRILGCLLVRDDPGSSLLVTSPFPFAVTCSFPPKDAKLANQDSDDLSMSRLSMLFVADSKRPEYPSSDRGTSLQEFCTLDNVFRIGATVAKSSSLLRSKSFNSEVLSVKALSKPAKRLPFLIGRRRPIGCLLVKGPLSLLPG